MKKILFPLVFSLILSGCAPKTESTTQAPQAPTPTQANIITTVRDAITQNLVLKCEYIDEDGGKTITYIQGKSVRMIGADESTKNINGLIKDQKFYVWELEGKQGMVIDMAKIGTDNPLKMGETEVRNEEDVINVLESQKDKCSISPADASLLELPTDIEFKEFGGW